MYEANNKVWRVIDNIWKMGNLSNKFEYGKITILSICVIHGLKYDYGCCEKHFVTSKNVNIEII